MKILSERKRSHQFDSGSDFVSVPGVTESGVTGGSTSSLETIKSRALSSSVGSCQYSNSSCGHSKGTCHDDGNPVLKMTTPEIYHEKQVRALCALHALNNLFQGPVFEKHDLDSICDNLAPDAWLNPHKSVFGLGNYDINVIMTALQNRGYEAVWFDKRRDPATLNLSVIFGFIFNIPTDCKVGWVSLPMKRKHWYAVKVFEDHFYNLDSKMDAPVLIGNSSALIGFFREELKSKEKELFLIMSQEASQTQSWNLMTNPLSSIPKELQTSNSDSESSRKESADSGVVELLGREPDLNIVDLDKEPSEQERIRFS